MSAYEPRSSSPALVVPPRRRGRRSSLRSWRRRDQLIYLLAWSAGIALCLIAGAIVVFLAVQGLRYLDPALLVTSPSASVDQSQSGGILDPIEGTLALAVLGTLIATPIAVATAIWVIEYGRPRWLARIVETSIELIAGTPDIVIAIFGLAVFQLGILAPFSFRSSAGGVYGRSFLAAGIMVSLVALPLTYTATRNGLRAIPRHLREASYALGKTRITTSRHRDGGDARPRADHRQHRDRRRAARGDAAERSRERRPVARIPARHGFDAAQLHPQQLASRRRQCATEGLRRGVRADADHPGAQLGGRTHLAHRSRCRAVRGTGCPMSARRRG
jgi:ABC-type sulfate transport system permease component